MLCWPITSTGPRPTQKSRTQGSRLSIDRDPAQFGIIQWRKSLCDGIQTLARQRASLGLWPFLEHPESNDTRIYWATKKDQETKVEEKVGSAGCNN
jgi:hypothetical protein